MQENNNTSRIEILDGLRVIAILMVMIFHFYSRFEMTHYTYTFKSPEVFQYGYLGVQLFFIISGFVITLTLTKCRSFFEFIRKRFIRLIPGMIICSSLTFLFLMFFDTAKLFGEGRSVSDLLFSNTFISPVLANGIFNTNFEYIDGAYWSLWVELQFYVFGGILYFVSPKNFLRNYALFSIIGLFLFYFFTHSFGLNNFGKYIGENLFLSVRTLFINFSIFLHGLWFLLGIIINKLYFQKQDKKIWFLMLFVFALQLFQLKNVYAICFAIFVMLIFLTFLYFPKYLSFLGNKLFGKVGVASYSIYLIHQNVGVLSINKLSYYFGDFNWLIPILLIVLFSVFGILSYKYLENPLGKKLNILFFKKKQSNGIKFSPNQSN